MPSPDAKKPAPPKPPDPSATPSADDNGRGKRLDGWKEIAAHLGRDERTAQRWAKRGLPVYHIPGGLRGRVVAYSSEIDAWIRGDAGRAAGAALPAAHPAHATGQPQEPESTKDPLPTQHRRNRFVWAIALVVLAIGGLLWKYGTNPARAATPARIELRGKVLAAVDRAGAVLWEHTLPGKAFGWPGDAGVSKVFIFEDLDADGESELVTVASWMPPETTSSSVRSQVLCFSLNGRLEWSYEFSETLHFGGREFPPPWQVAAVLVTGEKAGKRIWVGVNHVPWWPGLVIELDGHGREVSRFVNSGHIRSLAEMTTPQGRFVLAGGVNNEHDSGMMAVLRAEAPAGRSPQTPGSAFACDHCPHGGPGRYFLFPRSELNRVTMNTFNQVEQILVAPDRIVVSTLETESPHVKSTHAIHEFSLDFTPLRSTLSDGYWDAHRQLFFQQHVRHPPEHCPERRTPPAPREWRAGRWQDVQVAAAEN